MRNISDETFHTWTLILATLIVLVILAYALVFVNPRIAFNPLKPPLAITPTSATLAAAKAGLPPTWTPTLTATPTETRTQTPTSTNTPTLTPTSTSTPIVLPTATARPPTRTPAASTSSAASSSPSNQYRPVLVSCTHSGGVYIKGKVTSGGSPQEGLRVRINTSPDTVTWIDEGMARNRGDGNASFDFVLSAIGNFKEGQSVWYLWLVDAVGNSLSDPNFHVTTNTLPPDSPFACWLAVVDFVR